jgi:SAM-dependent methyltransferase
MQRWSVSPTCPFCKGASSPCWEKVDVRKCAACGLRFRCPTPTAGQLTQRYETSWSDPETHRRETGGTDPELATIYATKLASSLGRRDFSGLRLLDFGAGRGAMVVALQELSGEVYAVDGFGRQYLERHGFRAWHSVDNMPPDLAFDGIVAVDVVDRLPTLPTELTRLKNLLVPGGWIYLSAPNAHGLNARLCASNWREAVDRGPLFFFTPSSMQSMLTRCGFRRPQRLRWLIPYGKNSAFRWFQYLLQLLWMDGGLRYIAFRD